MCDTIIDLTQHHVHIYFFIIVNEFVCISVSLVCDSVNSYTIVVCVYTF